jgi:SprT protein
MINPQLERNRSILLKYIPENTVDVIAEWIYRYDFKLKIKKSRASKYGDYMPPIKGKNHQITINHDMNKYAFLITLVHEVAHLTNWQKHRNSVKPHGDEWKQEFRVLMQPFIREEIFPPDVLNALARYMRDPAASSCSDPHLMRVLKNYDVRVDTLLLEQLEAGTVFMFTKRYFVKGEKIRTRFKCIELKTKREYLFSPLAEVYLVKSELFSGNT